ncbi:HAMP domain-containing sensor histidine kinase [Bacillus sonorensis]|uniref:histidine kinase n=2 Tax=Bacillus sonorensis TaxID=119858 RepID=M5PF04_9BACI|nr:MULTISPECIES: HAMP domain-containing sensor histidine kinase [Bacillus]TWK72772.1 Alkaline phosphatase synthesis sensor protein PhoR [Bacillus paralicheniformis]ASB90192.1 Sensor histidine kinase CssS [Bacillus sonorensis]EME76035.1 two-component sensor histidine kinase [Bacillus sonorensis L12]MCZ0074501.1 HAMP domain-containing sensor histidine kinase [Bacillus sonorensis]MCZ0093609.1 HAMP domain-containing sensor histidine kinase [Bacillus sonorensis]
MKSISFKLAGAFFIFTLFIESILFVTLYSSIVNTRINDEIHALQKRGNSHRDVLEKHFDQRTVEHVALMETEAETNVIITDKNRHILAQSVPGDMTEHLHFEEKNIPRSGTALSSHWNTAKYICAISPIMKDGKTIGYVFMYLETSSIQALVQSITKRFIICFGLTGIFTVIAIFLFSRFLTRPIIMIKETTESIMNGQHDISLDIKRNDELGELAASIENLSSGLNRLQKERNDFLSSVAHELRTPITYIKGYTDIAMRDKLDDAARHQYLSIIKEETDNLARLVDDLFLLTKLKQPSFTIQKKRVHLHTFIQKEVQKSQIAFSEKQIGLSFYIPKNLYVSLDEKRFSQVMTNLLNNARHYSDPDTEVTVTAWKSKDEIIITVADEGCGIPEEERSYIFERFYRIEKSRSRQTGGTGMGLAIVKEMVEHHGGLITVNGRYPKGSEFMIRLPAEK